MTNHSQLTARLALAAGVALAAGTPVGAVVTTLTPPEIHLNNTATASFTNGSVTLTPFVGSTPVTFNSNATRLGIDNDPAGTTFAGTNVGAFNDGDTDPNNNNDERLQFVFAPTVGLSRIDYDFSRADGPGPGDGVFISGFQGDPGVSFSIAGAPFVNAALTTSFNAATGTVELDIPGSLFGGTRYEVNFNVPAASAGRTLLLSVTDSTQAGAQFAIRSISYSDDLGTIPTPGDVNGDSIVNIADFNIIRANFYIAGTATRAQGDLTFDGRVTISDFDQWKDAFPGNGAAFAARLFGVPEPGAALIAALAAAASLAPGRRRG